MFKFSHFTLVAMLASGPAFAWEHEQYANLINVEPGDYTLNEMVRLSGTSGRSRHHLIQVIESERDARQAAFEAAVNTALRQQSGSEVTVARAAR